MAKELGPNNKYEGVLPRLASMGIPVACEVDIYGALSEYIGCVSGSAVTLLDINNTVPQSIYDKTVKNICDKRISETFMGAPSKAISSPVKSHFSACSQRQILSLKHILPRAMCLMLTAKALAQSAYLPLMKWNAFTVMCLFKSVSPITVQ